MAKLDLVLESVRDRYMINVLEEGTTELGALKTKRFLTENTQRIKEILIQEGVMDGVKAGIQNAYLKAKTTVDPRVSRGVMGLGALAGAGAIAGEYGDEIGAAYDNVADKVNTAYNKFFHPTNSAVQSANTALDGLVDKDVTQSNETVADLNKHSQVFAQPATVKVTGLDYDKTHAGGFDNRLPKGYWDKH